MIPATGATFDAVVRSLPTDLEPPLQFIVADTDVDDARVDSQTVGVGAIERGSRPVPSS